MVIDAGYIPLSMEVISIAGTGNGIDTVLQQSQPTHPLCLAMIPAGVFRY